MRDNKVIIRSEAIVECLLIPERSKLYSLEPMGANSRFVESLSSYICRLAEVHNLKVSTFLRKILYPELKSCPSILEGTKGRNFDGFQVNGIGITTLDFVNTLEKLTLRTDISYLTLLNYTALFPIIPRDFIRRKKGCPHCLKESKDKGENVYEQLLWTFRYIVIVQSTILYYNINVGIVKRRIG